MPDENQEGPRQKIGGDWYNGGESRPMKKPASGKPPHDPANPLDEDPNYGDGRDRTRKPDGQPADK